MNRHRFTLLLFPVALLFSITSCHFVNPSTDRGDYPVSLSAEANRTTFTQGDIITISDFKVTVTFNTEEVKVTSDAKLEAGDSLYLANLGSQSVGIYYSLNNHRVTTSVNITVSEKTIVGYQTKTFTAFDDISWPSKTYDTGNYFSNSEYEYYRVVKNGSYLKLLPCPDQYYTGYAGSFYNTTAIKNIASITISYFTSGSDTSISPRLYFGENKYYDHYISLNFATSKTSVEYFVDSYTPNYFLISSGSSYINVESVVVKYYNTTTEHGSSYIYDNANYNQPRIVPVTYSGSTFVDGETYVDVPTGYDTNTRRVTSTKRYTYYSYDYVESHPEYVSVAAMVDPVDVCNYFLAFGCAPANYGKSGTVSPLRDGKTLPSVSDVDYLFGSNARVIQQYSRTGGYADSVPYYGYSPTYYELDINFDGNYSTSSRQVGRVVVWATGFTGTDYGSGSQAVCTYTNDHYASFREYNNFGGFMPAFSAETNIAGAKWSNPITY